MQTIIINNIMPPNAEPMTMPAISPLVSPSVCDSVSATVGIMLVVVGDIDADVTVIEGAIDVVVIAITIYVNRIKKFK